MKCDECKRQGYIDLACTDCKYNPGCINFHDHFVTSLDRAEERIAKWPEWKKQALKSLEG
jgi:hypothetical protein